MINQSKNACAIVIGGSAGSIPVVRQLLLSLNTSFPLPIIICLHRMKNVPEGICEVLSSSTTLPVIEPNDKTKIEAGHVYIAPSNYHLLIEKDYTFSLSTEEPVNYSRPAIDLTLITAAHTYRNNLVGILLTGANKDGAEGMLEIKNNLGITIVQNPKECVSPTMPLSAIELSCVDFVMSIEEITRFLLAFQSKVFP